MAKVKELYVEGKNKSKEHRIEITVVFDEPITQFEAQEIILRAISMAIYNDNE